MQRYLRFTSWNRAQSLTTHSYQVKKLESSGGMQMEELVKKHQKETSDLVKESNR
jgi:hypothetical protein